MTKSSGFDPPPGVFAVDGASSCSGCGTAFAALFTGAGVLGEAASFAGAGIVTGFSVAETAFTAIFCCGFCAGFDSGFCSAFIFAGAAVTFGAVAGEDFAVVLLFRLTTTLLP